MGDSVEEAGFSRNKAPERMDEKLLLEKITSAIRHFGTVPSWAEFKLYRKIDKEFPVSAIQKIFKNKDGLVSWLIENISDRKEYEDIKKFCKSPDRTEAENKTDLGKLKDGYVYLIKSGSHYKIGKSGNLENRIKQIRVALPEAASLEHVIETDDPDGIEAYWHRRFSDQRANGEWFKLNTADIKAFKRRKFQ